MPIESSFAETEFGKFHVEAAGQGTPWLFIHGGTASAREWRPVLPRLSEHARCIAIDRLGCGESDRSRLGYDRATLTSSLFACADALGLDRFGVVGQSFGGFWGLSMAFTNPARLIGLVTVDSAGGPMTDDELAEWHARRAARRQARPTAQDAAEQDAAIEQTMHEIFADPTRVPPSFREDLRWQMQRAAPDQIAAVADDWEWVARQPYDRLNLPVLVVWGEADTMIPAERGRRLASVIANARYVGLSGVGHTCQVEAPQEFVGAVAPFLDEFSSRRLV